MIYDWRSDQSEHYLLYTNHGSRIPSSFLMYHTPEDDHYSCAITSLSLIMLGLWEQSCYHLADVMSYNVQR